MTKQKCKVKPGIVNARAEPTFYSFSIKTDKSCGSCHNINDTFGKMCGPDVAKNLNVKCSI